MFALDLSERHRHFLRVEQFVHAFFINVVINGAIVALILRGVDAVPLWGDAAIAPDLIGTGLLLPFLMCEIVTRVIRGQVASGKLPPLPPEQIPRDGLHRRSVHYRAAVLTVFGTVCGSLPVVALLHLANAQPVAYGAFVAWKALWGGVLAAMLSPALAWWALAAASEEGVAAAAQPQEA